MLALGDVGADADHCDRVSLVILDQGGSQIQQQCRPAGLVVDHDSVPVPLDQGCFDDFLLSGVGPRSLAVGRDMLTDAVGLQRLLFGRVGVGHHPIQVRDRYVVLNLVEHQRLQAQLFFGHHLPRDVFRHDDDAAHAVLAVMPWMQFPFQPLDGAVGTL